MILGWTMQPVGTQLLEARLPEPHRAYYRDGGPIAAPALAGVSMVVRQVDGNEVSLIAGVNADREIALEVEIVKREVFHGILVDRVVIDFRWQPCPARPATVWETC